VNPEISAILYAGCAVACLAWGVLVLGTGRGRRAWPPAAACIVTALWAASVALSPQAPFAGLAGALEVIRTATWMWVLLLLGHRISGRQAVPLLRYSVVMACGLTVLALITLVPSVVSALTWFPIGSPVVLVRLALVLMVVVMAENLYRNAGDATRWHVVLPCITLGGLAAFDVLLYAHAALSREISPTLADARAVLTALVAPLLAVGAVRDRRWRRDPPVSRQVVFHGATLLIAGSFLLAVGAVGEAIRHIGTDWTRAAEVGLWAGSAMAFVVALTARSVRSRLRRSIVDHFFAARFDYRQEWLRCVATLSEPGVPAPLRAIRAIADPADSPAGVLLIREPGENGLSWAESWNRPGEALSVPGNHPLLASLRDGNWVHVFGANDTPDLQALFGPLWLAVPLAHDRDGLIGIVLLARPRATLPLDVEVFDLLRSLGREVSMFLSERRSAERLSEHQHLQDHAQRFAFVAHDVKTVASQLTMLLANAEHNIQDPEFQRDMLLTVRASAARINTLIARLRQPDASASASGETSGIDPIAHIRALASRHSHPVDVEDDGQSPPRVLMQAEAFDAAVGHLLNNAAEASPADERVEIRARHWQHRLTIDIVDHGPGMTPEFIRDALFRPLETRKPNGSGVGAWQARELLRRAGGDVTVLSRPGHGTTMRLTLPICDTPATPQLRQEALMS
jgi:putative PEP-CTERM system histidine kinase